MKILIFMVFLFCNSFSIAQNVLQAEYFIDTDAGVGNNSLVTLTNPLPDGTYNFNINLATTSVGYHKLYIRTKDSDGKWGITTRRNIEVTSTNTTKKIVAGEYFFDTDPGFNAANTIVITPQDSVILQNFTTVTNALTVGYHKLYLRLKDNDGNWSLTTRRIMEMYISNTHLITVAEYFFDTDAGVGSSNLVNFGLPLADGNFAFKIPFDKIPIGSNTLYVRVRDSSNKNWSITQFKKDSLVTSIQSGKWSQPSTWSSNKIPDANTIVLLYHNVDVDIVNATCKSLTPYGNSVVCIVEAGKAINITGKNKLD
jgi:hypothetical protein